MQKSVAELCKDAGFKKAVLTELQSVARSAKLGGFEVIRALHLEPDAWQPGGEVLTPTFKLQRNKAKEKYQAQINELYAELEARHTVPLTILFSRPRRLPNFKDSSLNKGHGI